MTSSSCPLVFLSQGLFRVAPSASKLKKLKASLDCGVLDVQEYSADPHAIAGELPPHHHHLRTDYFKRDHFRAERAAFSSRPISSRAE